MTKMALNYTDSDRYGAMSNHSNSTEMARHAGFLINYGLSNMIALATALSILIIFTALGNLLVLTALFRYRALRTISNCLIGNLAASDFLLAVTVLPLSAANECLGYWAFGRVACEVWLVVDVLCCTASIWNLCVIAADRYTATVHPVWYRDRSSARRRAGAYIGSVWAVSVAVCLPPLFGWNNEDNYRATMTLPHRSGSWSTFHECAPYMTPSYVLYSALGSFFVPFLVTVALYVRIGVTMHRRHASRRDRRRTAFGGSPRASGSSTVAMMCRVGNDLCATTATVVLDRHDLDEPKSDQSPTPGKLVISNRDTCLYGVLYRIRLPIRRRSTAIDCDSTPNDSDGRRVASNGSRSASNRSEIEV